MAPVHYLHDEIAVVGWSCRLPGANSVSELWSLLLEGRCAVSQVPGDRFPLARYGHPRRNERGKSYSWAAGILDDVWGFDPAVFGISPREAAQMDPQQRILLQLTWEALEDAGIPPAAIAGKDVGVFVGASQTDYGHAVSGDQAMADAHFATGNSLAVIANRISYIYDLHGPSVTLDTACSSSLVALHHAVEALRAGRIDTAIVGGINVIASPVEFISFSQASMLSPTGRCRAFSDDADGYVRAEGGVALVLRRGVPSGSAVHGVILASDVNSDGRTNGIALPSAKAQQELLERVYSRAGIDPERLSFVEAHGTGTPVGDPVEANAIGRSLGRPRSGPLPIGSIKTNIGHLEPASGLAGLVKSMLALNHRLLPRSLNFREPNPNIDFSGLNLTICKEPLLLPNKPGNCAGVNSFGFGGTNCHVVVAPGRKEADAQVRRAAGGEFFALSAASRPALTALAQRYCEMMAHFSDHDTATTASAIANRREWLPHRLVVATTRQSDVMEALSSFVAGSEHAQLEWGNAIGKDLPIAFVYSGNGSQWVGMGVSAYRHNARFRAHFDNIDDLFRELADWSLKDALFSSRLGERLSFTRVAQPLIFAIQSACTAALKARGLRPSAVMGHSVGEVAAAEAAGILDLRSAVEVIYFRSVHQERVRGSGRMAAILATPETVEAVVASTPGLEVAAYNSPRATTLAGSPAALAELNRIAADRGIPVLDLDLDYPFHTVFMAPIQEPLIADLRHIAPRTETVPFVSTATGACLPGSRLGADYWWRNIREPVQFLRAIRETAKLGARFFVEIGPRGMLLKHIADSLAGEVDNCLAVSVLDRNDRDQDPVGKVVSKALVCGAKLDTDTIFGPDPGAAVALPTYPWQQQPFRFTPTVEGFGLVESERRPFSGARYSRDALEWYSHIDTALFPALVDHKLGEHVIFPGTGFIEIALSVARAWLRTDGARLTECEILRPLDLTNGETREIMSRISPFSGILEIFSRPRLSESSWVLHCRCKILHSDARDVVARVPQQARYAQRQRFDSDAIYRAADAGGLHYGPMFRLISNVTVLDDTLIFAELTRAEQKGKDGAHDFVLDPIRLDACGHGLLPVFMQLQAPERGVSYIPVRVDEMALFVAGGVPQSVTIEVLSKNERSILADYYFFGPNQQLLAVARGIRCQAVQVRRSAPLETAAFVELPSLVDGSIVGATGPAAGGEAVVAAARRSGLSLDKAPPAAEAEMLIEGAATAVAYDLAAGLADAGLIDVAALVGSGRLAAELQPWLERLLASLEAASLAKRCDDRWQVIADSLMPKAALVIQELAAQHPDRAAEIFLVAAMAALTGKVAAGRAMPAQPLLSASALDFYDASSRSLRHLSEAAARLPDAAAGGPRARALRILQIGFGPLTRSLLRLQRRRPFALTVFEPDRRRFGSAQALLARHGHVALVGADKVADIGPHDVAVAADSLHRLPADIGLAGVRQKLAPHGLLLAVEPLPSVFRNLVFGFDPDRLHAEAPARTVEGFRRGDEWPQALARAEFVNVRAHLIAPDVGPASLLVAEADAGAQRSAAGAAERQGQFTLVLDQGAGPADLGALLDARLRRRGVPAALTQTLDFADPAPTTLVHVVPTGPATKPAMERLAACCLGMKASAERYGSARATLWFVFSAALASERGLVDPVAAGAWAFSRTLANEFPHLDVRRIDIGQNAAEGDAVADRLCDIILSGTAETELQLDGGLLRAVRVDSLKHVLDHVPARPANAVRLQRQLTGGQRFRWEAAERTPPAAGEVEIAVAATGLNFRDLMLMLSLLPDDMVEEGAAGPTLGCECAGEITRVGPGVGALQVGDRVTAFAASAFATHVTVAADQVAKLPATIDDESAATIPVAFVTAYYSLVTHARLKRGEWVLIHGGAGGVGLAAIQVALARKARVIATAGSKAKRGLLRSLGVHHVLDSRSTSFVDEVRAITGDGVDVVLNSLAGEAMERSIACLRDFGRFIELGKRDYVANTHIGLRPFRKNLSYFGVDVSQLMAGRKTVIKKIYAELMRQFDRGVLTPLPHSVFPASELSEAFHLMQHSGHVGKIVVRPPGLDFARPLHAPFAPSASGTHVIAGGFGGFGLAAAKWLVERGARHLVLVGRHGAASEAAQATVAELRQRGVKLLAESCDITDRHAVETLFERIQATMPPVVGILHAAMVLDDGLLSNLDQERFHRVLAPKVAGLDNIDAVTRGMALDYFVMFSSATTLIGNPGQANYVAANAYMEGLARRRRREGGTALAIGWGPIIDVGVVARSEALRNRLGRVMGVRGMRAAEALDLMAQALELPPRPEFAVLTVSAIDGMVPSDRLQALKSPTYANLVRGDRSDADAVAGQIDLHAIAASQGIEAARRALTGVIVSQLARVLHAREEEISRVRPVSEIGLDSLMALEFAMSLEDTFGIHVTLNSGIGTLTVAGLVNEIICQLDLEPAQAGAQDAAQQKVMAKSIAERHFEKAEPLQLAVLEQLVGDSATKRKGARS